ncbi:MAG: S-adenosylmethionine decarboxylase [Chitinispirillia bacterium]|nr:S-adenosylmethionine decarboxylase [Chitinispirillia bacterium]
MIHIMLDAYGCTDTKLDDIRAVYAIVSKIANVLGVATIMPPIVVPYYYGTAQADDGISAFVLLREGHLTIHTFPERECYFVDVLYNDFFNADRFESVLLKELPFKLRIINYVDRRSDIKSQQQKDAEIDVSTDFGPHYLIRNKRENNVILDIGKIYIFLDNLPLLINMTPIMRPVVITDKIKSPNIISGMTMIAQSHIALHYNITSKSFFADIFSCSFVDCKDITKYIEEGLGVGCENILISRGSKHVHRAQTRKDTIARCAAWRENI